MSRSLKLGIFLLAFLWLFLGVISLIDTPLDEPASGSALATETPISEAQNEKALEVAVKTALAAREGRWDAFTYQIDHIQHQDDGQMAIVWLAAVDPESGDFLGREPELALAQQNEKGQWEILLEGDSKFFDVFKLFQYAEKSILDGDFLSGEQQALPKSTKVYGGYYLPWAAGLEKRLTWSVGHTSCYPIYYCTHAFDFADGTMFPLVAAKGGTVFHWHDTCANGDPKCTNSITLQDKSTTPWTYQVYIHIAQGSVPDKLKTVGTPVNRGEYIARVDDTGASTGHHVHFMVVTEDTRYFSYSMNSIWGVAEDITFRDVDINWDPLTQGGRPRLAYEATTYGGEGRTYYVSGNTPSNPPTGGLTLPVTKTYFTTPTMKVSGWGVDNGQVVKAELLANYSSSWHTIAEIAGGGTFTTDIDLCKSDVPDGPFQIALRLWDNEGNPSLLLGTKKLIKNVACGDSGSDPEVAILTQALSQSSTVAASVTKGTAGSEIESVEFWLNGRDWHTGNWVYLGKDTYGVNGWQVPVSTADRAESNDYVLVAVATDDDGNQGADVKFNTTIDHTPPWVELDPIASPVMEDSVTLTWKGGDDLSGLSHYALAVKINSGQYQVLNNRLSEMTKSFKIDIAPAQLLVVSLTAYDKAGNEHIAKSIMYSNGYEFPYQILLFPVSKGN